VLRGRKLRLVALRRCFIEGIYIFGHNFLHLFVDILGAYLGTKYIEYTHMLIRAP